MINVFITIDVETSIGGAFNSQYELLPVGAEKCIYGSIGDKQYGIPLIIDILNRYQLAATFFVEPFCSFYFGEEMVKEVCDYISSRGHDVQLHLHPNYRIFSFHDWRKRIIEKKGFSDILADYTLEQQIETLGEAKLILNKCGITPVAFRAGCFGANLDTLRALKKNGLLFDSSYNASYLGRTCFINLLPERPKPLPLISHSPPDSFFLNDLALIDGVYEFPISNYYQFKIGKIKKLRPLEICAISFYEMKQILKDAAKKKHRNINVILHSFSFIKKKDVQYKTAKPNFIVIKRFINLCRFLQENKNLFQVNTFSQLASSIDQPHNLSRGSSINTDHDIPFIGNLPSLIRYISQTVQYF